MFYKLNADNTTKSSAINHTTPSSAASKSFYDMYAQQLLRQATNPILLDSNGDTASSPSVPNTGTFDPMMMANYAAQSAGQTGLTSMPVLDTKSLFGQLLGKAVTYYDAESKTTKEAAAIQVGISQNNSPYLILENGVKVRLERVIEND